MSDVSKLKELRERTGLSVMACKKALEETGGDLEKAATLLQEQAAAVAAKKVDRETREGIVASYVHPTQKVGAMVQLLCETDFVAKSPDFQQLARELCLQIVAAKPLYIAPTDVPEQVRQAERELFLQELRDAGKPAKLIGEIVENKIQKRAEESSLLTQAWIKNQDKTMQDLIQEAIAKLGENITVKTFSRLEI